MNELTIVGNVTAEPVLRTSEQSGRGVLRFDVAVNRRRFNRETSQYEDLPAVFHRVVAFGPLAEHAADSIEKGNEVVVTGQLADDSYEKDGERRRQVVLEAQVIGVSLRFGTAKFTKAARFTAGQREVREVYDGE
jgi:single-strand DNA-binding protein